jgi:hypothetical protein
MKIESTASSGNKEPENDLDTIVNAVILMAGSAPDIEVVQQWASVADLPISLALGVRNNLVTGLTAEGEQLVRTALATLAKVINVSEDRLIDIAYEIDSETSSETDPGDGDGKLSEQTSNTSEYDNNDRYTKLEVNRPGFCS